MVRRRRRRKEIAEACEASRGRVSPRSADVVFTRTRQVNGQADVPKSSELDVGARGNTAKLAVSSALPHSVERTEILSRFEISRCRRRGVRGQCTMPASPT